MMRRRFALIMIAAVVSTGLLYGCDRDDDDADSPPVTYGGAAVADEQPEADESPPQQHDEPQPDDIPDPAPGVARHVTDLPEGTDEQRKMLIEGRTAFLNDQYEEAAEIFEELALDEPISSQTISAAVALGQIYLETGRSEQALDLFDQLEEHAGDVPEILLVLARTYEDLGHSRQAIDAYEKAFEAKPDYIFILPEMAELLMREGQKDRAADVLVDYENNVIQLASHLEDHDETSEAERVWIADIFALISDERAHDALRNALVDDPSDTVRTQAAIALGESAAFDYREQLERAATEDESESVRLGARRGLDALRNFEEKFEREGN